MILQDLDRDGQPQEAGQQGLQGEIRALQAYGAPSKQDRQAPLGTPSVDPRTLACLAGILGQQNVFLLRPSAEEFQALRVVSRKLGTWDQVRAEALKALEGSKRFGPLTAIALHEGDVSRAVDLLSRMQPWERGPYQWQVAQAAEKSHPRESLARRRCTRIMY